MPNTLDVTIGKAVAQYRERAGLTQSELAQWMNKSGHPTWRKTTVSQVELGERSLKASEIVALSGTLAIGVEQLITPDNAPVQSIIDGMQTLLERITADVGKWEALQPLLLNAVEGNASIPRDVQASAMRLLRTSLTDLLTAHPVTIRSGVTTGWIFDPATGRTQIDIE